jgi:hypothetical protein
MGDALAHVPLGEDHVLHAQLGEDARVRLADGLGPDVQPVSERDCRCQAVGHDVTTDGDNDAVEVGQPDLGRGLLQRGIGRDHLGQVPRQRGQRGNVDVDAQHLRPAAFELQCESGAEPSQSDHDDRARHAGLPSQ